MADDSESHIVAETEDAALTFCGVQPAAGRIGSSDHRGVQSVREVGDATHLLASGHDISTDIFQFAVAHHCAIKTLKQQERSMEEVFRELTK